MKIPWPIRTYINCICRCRRCVAFVYLALQQYSFALLERLEPTRPTENVRCGSSINFYSVYRNHRFVFGDSVMRLRRRVPAIRVCEPILCGACPYMGSRLCGWPNLTPQTKILSPHPIYYCDQHIHDELLWFYYEFCGFLVCLVALIRFSYCRPFSTEMVRVI